MRYPKFINKNDRLGFIAPSFGAVIEPYSSLFKNALQKFEVMGYKTVLGPNCFADNGVGKSNTPEQCAEEINDFFINDRCDVIMSCGGGETMCEDLSFVDFESIAKAEPKWFIGYSDNTCLTFTLPTLCDTAAIYGPCATSFGMEPWHEAIYDAFDLLHGKKMCFCNYPKWEKDDIKTENPLAPYNATEPFDMKLYTPAGEDSVELSGRLIGGCIDVLQILCGTKFDKAGEFADRYKNDGIVWFLENCELNPMALRRALWQMDSCGWFKNVKGFIIGRTAVGEMFGYSCMDAVHSILDKYSVPILFDVDLGHLPPMIPIVIGSVCKIKAFDNKFELEYIDI